MIPFLERITLAMFNDLPKSPKVHFEISTHEHSGKCLRLSEAVRQYVQPGMALHLAAGVGGPGAAIREIIRQFYGKNPGFTLIQGTITGHALNILHCQLVNKIIFTACVDISTSGRPSKIMQKIWAEKKIPTENWSLLSLQQRLMAGAMGLNCITTRSLFGSDLAVDNQHNFVEMADPFDSGKKIGLLKALNPDLSIVHGCVADVQGNTILTAPYADDIWGPLASKNGVLVTVEKIVSSEFIQEHAALVKIPGHLVNSVSLAPMGLHPFSMANPGIRDFEEYETDLDFLQNYHDASADETSLDNWIKEWILDCPTDEEYLNKISLEKIAVLKQKKIFEIAQPTLKENSTPVVYPGEFTDEEMMIVAASREIIKTILQNNHRIVMVGVGSPGKAVLMAYYQLQKKGCDIKLITGNGRFGFEPLKGELATQGNAAIHTAKMLTDTIMTQGVFVAGGNSRCLSVLGAGQIDKFGNINSTLTDKKEFLIGSGGANDAMNAQEVMILLNQSKGRLPAALTYITSSGKQVTKVITNLGIFTKSTGQNELSLRACFPDGSLLTVKDKIKRIQDRCGWTIKLGDQIEELPLPLENEIELLRWIS
jgi:acyl CoA:acetate/3-ketoacid CoA transferase beta subunit/acyl CoA:acetate/3-ketoacid CoA transferase alpha subunit